MAEFADLASKLGAPSKKSQFERQKAEAETKKAREKAETAAVLAEFEKSFDDDENDARYAPASASRGPPAPGKRHFTSTNLKSGPGSLPRSGPGSLGPAFKKRPFDDYTDRRDRERGYHPDHHVRRDEQEQEDEKAAKPTLHLASMPPSSSPAFIKGLFAHTPLTIDNVRILPASTASGTSGLRRSSSAIVTLAAETPATDIDTVVSHLQNKYLGYGFKLSISRHLSSAALGSTAITTNAPSALPFGARAVAHNASLSRAPPPNQRFAPPQSYSSSYSREPATQVIVQPPSDLKQLKLIHKTLEAVLTYGPEFEALLMSRSEIQREEKWSWLWDSSIAGGIYYRWRLWSILTTSNRKDRTGPRQEIIFEGESSWHAPDHGLRFEYTTELDDFVNDEDYNSSDEEDDDDDGRGGNLARRYNDHNTSAIAVTDEGTSDGMGYLDPLAKAKLTHLLSRLPDANTKLRRGDVARITAFAIQHAGAGGDEVAALITRNVVRPFSASDKNEDNTSASMVGLYVISDILSCSASAGVRHAWRYRTLFEQALRQQQVFEKLGRAEKNHKWGKLKGEKWKRSVQSLLSLWEGWSVFPQTAQEEFSLIFNNPPLTEEEKRAAAESDAPKKPDDDDKSKATNRWKMVEDEASADVSMEDIDGTPMADDDEDMESGLENIDGISMVDSSEDEADATKLAQAIPETEPLEVEPEKPPAEIPALSARRQRPKAADLFS